MNHDPRPSDGSTNVDQQLDRLLGDWGTSRTDALGNSDELHARILSQVASGSAVNDRPSVELCEPNVSRSSGWLLVGISAIVLVVVGLSIQRLTNEPQIAQQVPPPVPSQNEYAPPTVVAAQKALLFDELEQVFGGQFCWVAETGNDVRLGMCPHDEPIDKQHPAVSVRLVVVQRIKGQQQWSPVWSMDVTTRSEHLVRTGPGDTNVALWVYRMPDGMLAVDSDLTLSGPVQLQSTYSGIQQFDVPSEIHTATIDDSEYTVFQTIVLLDETDDVS
jgi:hypothetical protein